MLRTPTSHVCPGCGSEDIDRVAKRTALDQLARAFGWRVYRCRPCGRRFYDGASLRPGEEW